MIVDLPSTTTADVAKRLVRLRADTGSMALSRVLTLLVVVDEGEADAAIDDGQRREPPAPLPHHRRRRRQQARRGAAGRPDPGRRRRRRVGGRRAAPLRPARGPRPRGRDAAAARRLPHRRVVADERAETAVGRTPSGRWRSAGSPTRRRRLDRPADRAPSPRRGVRRRRHRPRVVAGHPVARPARRGPRPAARTSRSPRRPSSRRRTPPRATCSPGWLAARLRCPVTIARSRNRSGIISVRLERASGTVDLVRPLDGNTATLAQPGQPVRTLALAHRGDAECLADELRRLDPDEVYEDALARRAAQVHRLAAVGSRCRRVGQGALGRRVRPHRQAAAAGGARQRQQRHGRGAADARRRPTTPPASRRPPSRRLAEVKERRS